MKTQTKPVRRRKVTSVLLWLFAIVFFNVYGLMSVVGGSGWSVALSRHDHMAMRRYLALPVHPDFLGIQGTTPLFWATRSGEVETVRVLLARGADPIRGIYGVSYRRLVNARSAEQVWQEYIPYVRSGRIRKPNDFHTVLRSALWQQDWDTAGWLIKQGADVNRQGNFGNDDTLLVELARNPQDTMVSIRASAFLLRNGAWVNARDYNGVTALTLAAEAKNKPLIRLLKQYGARR